MYFQKFPQTLYSLDDRKSVQIVTNILQRVIIKETIKNNLSLFDEYDIIDGETPEIIAAKVYGNSNYHWIIMLANERFDYREDFPLDYNALSKRVTSGIPFIEVAKFGIRSC